MFWEFNTNIITIKVITFNTTFTDFYASLKPFSINFLMRIHPTVFCAIFINWFFNWDAFFWGAWADTMFWFAISWITTSTKSCTWVPLLAMVTNRMAFSIFIHVAMIRTFQTQRSIMIEFMTPFVWPGFMMFFSHFCCSDCCDQKDHKNKGRFRHQSVSNHLTFGLIIKNSSKILCIYTNSRLKINFKINYSSLPKTYALRFR